MDWGQHSAAQRASSSSDRNRGSGLSRSQLIATALAEFVAKHRGRDVTRRLDAVYMREASTLDPATRRLQARARGTDQW